MRSQQPQLSVVIPTRNEQDNIAPLLTALGVSLAGITTEVIFIDDSDDTTPEHIILESHHRDDQLIVRLIHRASGPERAGGLATAVTTGLQQATAVYVAVIDADLQHPPAKLRDLYETGIQENADVVMATRYLAGGSYEGLDGVVRKAISVGMKWVAKLIFPDQLIKVSDPLGGFFLIRRSLINGVTLRPIGYKISLELLIRTKWARMVEVPYSFQTRSAGQSKANVQQGLMALHHMWRLFHEVPAGGRFWKYGLTNIFATLFAFTLFQITAASATSHWSLWIAALEAPILLTYICNLLLTLRDIPIHSLHGRISQVFTYHVAMAASVVLNMTFLLFDNQQTAWLTPVALFASVYLGYRVAKHILFLPRASHSVAIAQNTQSIYAATGLDFNEREDSLHETESVANSMLTLSGHKG